MNFLDQEKSNPPEATVENDGKRIEKEYSLRLDEKKQFCSLSHPECIDIQEDTVRGKHVSAKKTLQIGNILSSNVPTSHLLLSSYWGSRCIYCFKGKAEDKQELKLARCSKCQKATYCCRTCQQQDWPQHKLECSKLKLMWDQYHSQILDEILILLRQISVEKTMKPDCEVITSTLQQPTTKCGLNHLHSLYSQPKVDHYLKDFYYKQIIKVVSGLTQRSELELAKLMNQFHCNNFGIMDDLMNCIGMGVYPSTALLNHSCRPNAILRYKLIAEAPICEVVPICEIAEGSELTHSYTDCTNPRHLRQESLKNIYGFRCSCVLCQATYDENSSPIKSIKEYLVEDPLTTNPLRLKSLLESIHSPSQVISVDGLLTSTIHSKIPWNEKEVSTRINTIYEKIYYEGDQISPEEEKELIQELFQIETNKFQCFYGPFHYELYRFHCKLLTILVLTGDQENAFKVCCQVVSYLILALINMPNHPLIGIQLFTLGDLAQSVQPDQAREYYKWAANVLAICYGPDNSMVQKLQAMILS